MCGNAGKVRSRLKKWRRALIGRKDAPPAHDQAAYLLDVLRHPNDLAPPEERRSIPLIPQPLYFRSSLCTAQDFRHPEFARLAKILHRTRRLHRKDWEHVFIAAHLEAAGLVGPGRRGLGFGVGLEPLPAAFAVRGASVVATDLSPEDEQAKLWMSSSQHSSSLEVLNQLGICPPDLFAERVTFKTCDMRDIAPHFRDFDFCWSSCSLEHLGSIRAGVDFIKSSIDTLKVGGVAVHTTEYNVSSNEHTIDNNPNLVLFRRRDIEACVADLRAAGHFVADLCFDVLSEPIDLHVDIPPYAAANHLRLILGKFVSTSVGLVIQRGR